MKAVLKFNLPEDQNEFEFAIEGNKWWGVVWDMEQWLRSKTKYASDDMSDDTYKAFEECREQLREFIDEYNLNLDK